jgi:hypothetical protein
MTARAQLLRHLADLPEEDVQALLVVAERLRAKHLAPAVPVAGAVASVGAAPSPGTAQHPERFGSLSGSARFSGDVESPVVDADMWTFDAKNLGV